MTSPRASNRGPKERGFAYLDETGMPALAAVIPHEASGVTVGPPPRFHPAAVGRAAETPSMGVDAEQLREKTQDIARRAWHAFKDACTGMEIDGRESNYLAARSALDELWMYAKYRDAPFRDLLAILTAAIKHSPLEGFDDTQKDVIRDAFLDLARWPLDQDVVLGHIGKFAEYDVDITAPLRAAPKKKFRVTIEEFE